MIWVILSAVWAGSACAQSAVCVGAERLSASATSCSANKAFVQAAQDCVDKFEVVVQAEQAAYSLGSALRTQAAAAAQKTSFTTNQTNLGQAEASLSSLINRSKQMQDELKEYQKNLTLPGGVSRSMARALGMESYLESFACYAENRKNLAQEEGRAFTSFLDLNKGWHQVHALGQRNLANDRVDNSPTSAAARAPAAAVSGGPTQPTNARAPKPASDITGTVEAKTKEQAAEEILGGFKNSGSLPSP